MARENLIARENLRRLIPFGFRLAETSGGGLAGPARSPLAESGGQGARLSFGSTGYVAGRSVRFRTAVVTRNPTGDNDDTQRITQSLDGEPDGQEIVPPLHSAIVAQVFCDAMNAGGSRDAAFAAARAAAGE